MSSAVRSIFFYNSEPRVGQVTGLHLFEPRYRLMIKRAVEEPERQQQIVFLPNYRSYRPAHGDVGLIAKITRYNPHPAAPGELPRADVELRFEARVAVLFHWIEEGSGSLCECVVQSLPELAPPPTDIEAVWRATHIELPGVNQLHPRIRATGASLVAGSRNVPSQPLLLHAESTESALAARQVIADLVPAVNASSAVHDVAFPDGSALVPLTAILELLAHEVGTSAPP